MAIECKLAISLDTWSVYHTLTGRTSLKEICVFRNSRDLYRDIANDVESVINNDLNGVSRRSDDAYDVWHMTFSKGKSAGFMVISLVTSYEDMTVRMFKERLEEVVMPIISSLQVKQGEVSFSADKIEWDRITIQPYVGSMD